MHNLATRPCGNLAVFDEDGQPTLSMLDMSFTSTLSPGPDIGIAVEKARPAYAAMLSEVLGVEQDAQDACEARLFTICPKHMRRCGRPDHHRGRPR